MVKRLPVITLAVLLGVSPSPTRADGFLRSCATATQASLCRAFYKPCSLMILVTALLQPERIRESCDHHFIITFLAAHAALLYEEIEYRKYRERYAPSGVEKTVDLGMDMLDRAAYAIFLHFAFPQVINVVNINNFWG